MNYQLLTIVKAYPCILYPLYPFLVFWIHHPVQKHVSVPMSGKSVIFYAAAAHPPPREAASLAVNLLQQLLDGGAELGVLAADHGGGVVEDVEVGLELGVLEIVALGGAVADDGDAEDERGVLHGDPVDAGHGAGHGGADEAANLLVAVHPGRAWALL